MPFDRFPGAARRDAHLLVVVADRAARGKGVAEPETVFLGNAVGVVRKAGGALVGGNHQIGVILVVANQVGRWHNLAADEIVGEVEQAAQKGVIAGDAFLENGIAIAARWRVLDDEAPLRADRHDHRVLDHLRLHQAQHLGAEIFHAVRPAQSATRYLAAAQVDAFDARRIDEDFPHRLRFGQAGDFLRVDLDRVVGLGRAVAALEVVAAYGGQNGGEELAQDAVIVEVGNTVEGGLDLRIEFDSLGGTIELRARVEAGEEEFEQ